MRFLRSYGVALLILLLVAGWLASGTLIEGGNGPGNGERPMVEVLGLQEEPAQDTETAEAEEQPAAEQETEQLQSVRIAEYSVRDMPIEVELRGRTEAAATVTATAETGDVVREVAVNKGDVVEEGDLLCRLAAGTREASVAQAEAALAQAQQDYDTNQKLRERGHAAPNTERQFEAALKSAQASLDQAEAELERTEIRAEMAGLVQQPIANVGDMLAAGATCATVVKLDPITFTGQIPQARVGNLQPGMPATVSTVTGERVEGEITYISSTADQATRTFDVEIDVPNPDHSIRSGVTASATVHVGTTKAHLLPQSVLTLDSEGTLGIRTVQDGTAQFRPIEILGNTRDGVWAAGLPNTMDVIIFGQEYVTDGQKVAASYGDAEDEETSS